MYSFIISLLVGGLCGFLYSLPKDASWGGIVVGVLCFGATYFLLMKRTAGKMAVFTNKAQEVMQVAGEKIQRKIKDFQAKPGANQQAMQKSLEVMQREATLEAIKSLDGTKALFPWSFLAERQINTMRYQLFYTIREFDEVDKLEKKLFLLDAQTFAMRLAREWARNPLPKDLNKKDMDAWSGAKLYKKSLGRLRGAGAGFLYSVYAYMLEKSGYKDAAIQVLTDGAKKEPSDATLMTSLENLRNGKKISNKGYGDRWFGLFLEAPPQQKAQRVKQGRKGQKQYF